MNIDGLFSRGMTFLLAGILLCDASAFGVQEYSIQSIGSLVPYGINDSSEVVGLNFVDNVGYTGAYLWVNGKTTPITPPAPFDDSAPSVAINNAGQIAIVGSTSLDWPRGVSRIWDPNSGFSSVGIPDGENANFGAINNLGQVGGSVSFSDGATPNQAAVWWSPQTPTLLPFLSASDSGSGVLALNDVGQAVGVSGFPVTSPLPAAQAVLWQNGSVIDLTRGHPFSKATGINNAGEVIGWYFDYDDETDGVPFMWDAANGLTVLPDDGGTGDPAAINQEGQIVGQVSPAYPVNIAALWDNGTLYDLNALLPADSGWELSEADGINDQGQIVGWGSYDGQEQGYLLTPIPEPAAISLATSFCLLPARRRRK